MNYEQRTQSRLEQAVQQILQRRRARTEIRFDGIKDAVRRRCMVKNIDLAAKHYDLREEVNAYLAKCDVSSVGGLKDDDLNALSGWMTSTMDRLSWACDHPDVPPAR
jgi:hypothetical protein